MASRSLKRSGSDRLGRMREVLHETSLVFDPQPRRVYELITSKVAEFYDTTSVLSIRDGDYMSFRAIAGVPPGAPVGEGNPLADAYCQFCVARREPIIIQDARLEPDPSQILPARLGVTRYAGVPLWTPDGQLIGTFCILDGRSDEILDAEDLRFLSLMAMRISSELERERQLSRLERDLAATQSRLIQSEKLAVTGTLAASIAHDIRNILSAISLTISMGQEDPATTLQELRGHLDRFEVLSHRLLVYARPKEVARENVDIAEVLRRVLDLLGSQFKVSSIGLDLKIEPELPSVRADASRLDHVFVNLILNGLQASSASKTLHVRAFARGGQVVVQIEDEGHGMSPETVERLFEPFSKSRSRGFGLGLYSCRHIIAECGGNIRVQSKPGVGSRFDVELPVS